MKKKLSVFLALAVLVQVLLVPNIMAQTVKNKLEIEKITGSKDLISVFFNQELDENADFEKIHISNNDKELNITCGYQGKRLDISSSELENDVDYDVNIEAGFECETAALEQGVRKCFCFKTVLHEDFEGEEIDDGISAGGRTVTVDTENKRRALWNAAVVITDDDVINAENLMLTFDFQVYNANLNNSDKTYNSIVPYSLWGYNLSSTAFENGYRLYIRPNGVTYHIINNKAYTQLSTGSYDYWQHGDGYWNEPLGQFEFYKTGDALPFEKNGVSVSKRDTPPVYHMELVKTGTDIKVYRDDDIIVDVKPDEAHTDRTTGYIRLMAALPEIMVIDNIRAVLFKLIEKENLEITSLKLNYDGELEAASEISGGFTVKNYGNFGQAMGAIIVAYGENSEMLGADVLNIGTLAAGAASTETFSIDGLSGVKQVKLILCDSLSNIKYLGCYGFI